MPCSSLPENINRRYLFVLGIQGVSYLILMGRLGYLQLWNTEYYKEQALKNLQTKIHLYPIRGEIIDRYGRLIATNQKKFKVTLFPSCLYSQSQRKTLLHDLTTRIRTHAPKCLVDQHWNLENLQKLSKQLSVTLCQGLTFDELVKLQIHHFSSFCLIEEHFVRSYPYREAMAHALGHVGLVTKEDLKLGWLSESRVGKAGIEKYL